MKTKSKKYFLMFEMLNCINYSSYSFDSLQEARKMLEYMRKRNDPLLVRAAVGFWDFVKCEDGFIRIFKLCSEFFRINK